VTVTAPATSTDERTVANPGHGDAFTDHMFSMRFSPEQGWHRPELVALQNLSLHPGMIGLHYGQVAFEGLKAYRLADGSMAIFRPLDHARRFQRSARRLSMPELDEQDFLRGVESVIAADSHCLSDNPAHSIYLRPFMFGTDESLMLRPSSEYRFLVMAFVAGGFFGDAVESVSVLIGRDYSRAMPGGTGDVKVAGNYAPSFVAAAQAQQAGCHQVVWLDAVERRWVEEMGGMNLFFVRGSGPGAQLVTPTLTGTLLPGVTRQTLLHLAGELGLSANQERISVDQWREESERGVITEAFACGTAAVVTPVSDVRDPVLGDWRIGNGAAGPVTLQLRRALIDLHHGVRPDPAGWLHRIR
jgi:branched-chain amino acid aminotransferase